MLLPRSQPFTVLPSLLGFYASQHTAARMVSARAATATRAPFPRLGNGSLPNLGGLSRMVDDSMKVEDVKIRYVQVCAAWLRLYGLSCWWHVPCLLVAIPIPAMHCAT
jgi:hypothetical protein